MSQPTWMGVYGALLLARHVRLISRNLTTNEAINYAKYDYLKKPGSQRFHNPFNRGALRNWTRFCG